MILPVWRAIRKRREQTVDRGFVIFLTGTHTISRVRRSFARAAKPIRLTPRQSRHRLVARRVVRRRARASQPFVFPRARPPPPRLLTHPSPRLEHRSPRACLTLPPRLPLFPSLLHRSSPSSHRASRLVSPRASSQRLGAPPHLCSRPRPHLSPLRRRLARLARARRLARLPSPRLRLHRARARRRRLTDASLERAKRRAKRLLKNRAIVHGARARVVGASR